ncbi:hypothetical protein HELRODRAFT_185539 [Helobdella robusta]|uniref:Phospholipase B-like n=1 Tax=Helobdella robusta TaxID=6412 RepID=T1FMY2_HELRO|nr:hypothetical protein HELRODRAFT_185539 [Helobdella robusta]ESO04980.1 hypothetical protein HELRODRAFT_185539 [Helobdella robusta]
MNVSKLKVLLITTLLIVCAVVVQVHGTVELSISWNERLNAYELKKGLHEDAITHASFKNSINSTGFAYLEIQTNEKVSDIEQAYTAGLAEGLLTSDLIKLHWYNTFQDYCKAPLNEFCAKLQNAMEANFNWMANQIFLEANLNPFWHQVELILVQLHGLIDGYKFEQRPRDTLTKFVFKPDVTGLFMLFLSGDISDLEAVLGGNKFNVYKPFDHLSGPNTCSALIKLLPGNKDLLISQTTWSNYGTMLRILKKYDFGYHTVTGGQLVPAKVISFSSYPGVQFSVDDFYLLSSGLVAQETTIGNSNADRWKLVKPESLLEVIRNMVANRLATTGEEWADLFVRYNSGTYNNQWMVLNYKLFTPGAKEIKDGLLYVVEQIPGLTVGQDVTFVLRNQTYWPSYNSPYFKEIFNASGCQENVKKYGDWFTYEKTPRALIFKRDHSKVVDMNSMMRLMRYNDFTHDPLSACNCTPPYSAENAIAARCDLNPKDGKYPFDALGHRGHGATDVKITSYSMFKNFQFLAVSGPTRDQVAPFQWSKSDLKDTIRHAGHPDLWVFDPVQF